MAVRIGVDLIEVDRVRQVFERNWRLKESVFTVGELRHSCAHRYPYVHLAACFAAKEALFKALETGLSGEMDWRDVEIYRERSGKAAVRLSGSTARIAEELGVATYDVSVTHTIKLAAALIILALEDSKQNVNSNITF